MIGLLVLAGALLSSCGASTQPLAASKILSYDSLSQTVHLDLVSAETDSFDGFNFDGYGGGRMEVKIPVGWTVEVTCTNDSTALTHSCGIVEGGSGTLSPTGGTIAFPGASTPDPVNGLAYGVTDHFSFVASTVGTYRIDCLVVGHEADGMWDWFVVTNGGKPSVTTSANEITPA